MRQGSPSKLRFSCRGFDSFPAIRDQLSGISKCLELVHRPRVGIHEVAAHLIEIGAVKLFRAEIAAQAASVELGVDDAIFSRAYRGYISLHAR